MIEKKVNSIVAEIIRILGPTVLRSLIQNNGDSNSGSSSSGGSTATAESPFFDDEEDDAGNSKVSVSLPTFPPDEDTDTEAPANMSSTKASQTTAINQDDRMNEVASTVAWLYNGGEIGNTLEVNEPERRVIDWSGKDDHRAIGTAAGNNNLSTKFFYCLLTITLSLCAFACVYHSYRFLLFACLSVCVVFLFILSFIYFSWHRYPLILHIRLEARYFLIKRALFLVFSLNSNCYFLPSSFLSIIGKNQSAFALIYNSFPDRRIIAMLNRISWKKTTFELTIYIPQWQMMVNDY